MTLQLLLGSIAGCALLTVGAFIIFFLTRRRGQKFNDAMAVKGEQDLSLGITLANIGHKGNYAIRCYRKNAPCYEQSGFLTEEAATNRLVEILLGLPYKSRGAVKDLVKGVVVRHVECGTANHITIRNPNEGRY